MFRKAPFLDRAKGFEKITSAQVPGVLEQLERMGTSFAELSFIESVRSGRFCTVFCA